jgi:signal transduction histidine kinase
MAQRGISYLLPLLLSVICVAASLVWSTARHRHALAAADLHARGILESTRPVAARLSTLRAVLRHLDGEVDREVTAASAGRSVAGDSARRVVESELDPRLGALASTLNDIEDAATLTRVRKSRAALDAPLEDVAAALGRGDAPGATLAATRVARAIDEIDGDLEELASAHLLRAGRDALAVRGELARSWRVAGVLDGICLALAGLAAILAVGAIRRQIRALDARATELDTFAGRVAHDILSPIGSVSLTLQVLRKAKLTPERQAELGERALATINLVTQMAEGLLEFARLGARPGHGQRNRLDEAIHDVVAGLAPLATAAGVEICVEAQTPAVVACSRGILVSVISNLLRNALKYMGEREHKRVIVRVRTGADCARVEVDDNGPGVPDGLEGRIFEPYVRGTSSGRGAGLGLATVKRLVEAHGGRVGVESALGDGSCFWFELPTPPELQEPPVDGRPTATASTTSAARVGAS